MVAGGIEKLLPVVVLRTLGVREPSLGFPSIPNRFSLPGLFSSQEPRIRSFASSRENSSLNFPMRCSWAEIRKQVTADEPAFFQIRRMDGHTYEETR